MGIAIMALAILSVIVLAQMICIGALMNRLLKQAGVAPIAIPKPEMRPEIPQPMETRRKLFSVPFSD